MEDKLVDVVPKNVHKGVVADDKIGVYFLDNFQRSLSNLKINDKKVIESLTEIAGVGEEKASEIVRIIVNNESPEGLLKLYLIDSIIKRVGGSYVGLFSDQLVEAFSKVFRIADYNCKKKLFMLRQSWNGFVSKSTLTCLDIKMNGIDGNWPVEKAIKDAVVDAVDQTTTDVAHDYFDPEFEEDLPSTQELLSNVVAPIPKPVNVEKKKTSKPILNYNSDEDLMKTEGSSQEVVANANLCKSDGKLSACKFGRPKNDAWNFVNKINGHTFCKLCDKAISAKAVRIRKHLNMCHPQSLKSPRDQAAKPLQRKSQETSTKKLQLKSQKAPTSSSTVAIQEQNEEPIFELKSANNKQNAVNIAAIRKPASQNMQSTSDQVSKTSTLSSTVAIQEQNEEPIFELKSANDKQNAVNIAAIRKPASQNMQSTSDQVSKTSTLSSTIAIQEQNEEPIFELKGANDKQNAVNIAAIRKPASQNMQTSDQVSKTSTLSSTVAIQEQDEQVLMCHLCGLPKPKLKCEECEESFCIACFDQYHNHPQRKSHLSKEIVKPSVIKELPYEWINTTEKLSIPKELWSKIYDNKEGKIITKQFTFYKNEIGDLLEKIVKCVILVRDQYVGKCMTIYTHCKHRNCRKYNLICYDFNCESPIFEICRTTNSIKHSEYLSKQLRGSTRESNEKELLTTMPATHFRNMVDKAPEYLLAEKNASTIKSTSVFKKCRSQGLKKQDLSPDDFKDLIMLQEETKEEDYINKVISPYGVYMHDSKQFKLLHSLIAQNKKLKIETIGRSDATGNVVVVAVVDGKPILYYTLMIQLKSDERNQHFTPFPVSEMISVTHDAPAIADWLFSFRQCYLKQYPADYPIFDRVITDFSYANIHAILHAFNATNIHLYLNEAYAYVTEQKTFNAVLLFWVKVHLCCTHLSNTFAENVHSHFNKKKNEAATTEQKVISEVLAAMMSMRNYNQLKETWHNLCILIKNKSENETTTQALQNLQRLCTKEFDPTKKFKYDYLIYGGDDITQENFEADGSILDKPIYKSSKFYIDFYMIYDEVKTVKAIKKTTNPYYNESFLPSFMKRFVAILPLWTGLLFTEKSKFLRLNNQPIESYNKIVKDLLDEKSLEVGFRVKCTRFIKLIRKMINSNYKLIFWNVPTGRLNHGMQNSPKTNSHQILQNLSKINSSSPVLPETSTQTTSNLQANKTSMVLATQTNKPSTLQRKSQLTSTKPSKFQLKSQKTSSSTVVIQEQDEVAVLQLEVASDKENAVDRTPVTQNGKASHQATEEQPQIRKSSRLAAKVSKYDKKGAGPSKKEKNSVVSSRQSTTKQCKDKTSIKNALESWNKRKYKGNKKERTSYFEGKTLSSLEFENTEE